MGVLELESETRPIPLQVRTLTGTRQLTFLSLYSFVFKMEISIYFTRLVTEYKIWGFPLSSSTFRPSLQTPDLLLSSRQVRA